MRFVKVWARWLDATTGPSRSGRWCGTLAAVWSIRRVRRVCRAREKQSSGLARLLEEEARRLLVLDRWIEYTGGDACHVLPTELGGPMGSDEVQTMDRDANPFPLSALQLPHLLSFNPRESATHVPELWKSISSPARQWRCLYQACFHSKAHEILLKLEHIGICNCRLGV